MGDSGRLTEYAGEWRVWKIEEGGEYHGFYASERPMDALAAHMELGGGEPLVHPGEELTIELVDPKSHITVTGLDADDLKAYPEGWIADDDDPGTNREVSATAAEWADYEERRAEKRQVAQICSNLW